MKKGDAATLILLMLASAMWGFMLCLACVAEGWVHR